MATKPAPPRPLPRLYLATPVVDDPAPLVASLSRQDFPNSHFEIGADGVFAPTSGRGAAGTTVDGGTAGATVSDGAASSGVDGDSG